MKTQNLVVNNHELIAAEELNLSTFSRMDMFYEVVRIINGHIVFAEDHMQRMITSLSLANLKCKLSAQQILDDLNLCISSNGLTDGNVRISAYYDGNSVDWVHEIVPHFYPTPEQYLYGVPVAVARFVRERPNIKKWNQSMKDVVKRFKSIRKAYEVLLFNENNEFTEGSQSNLFFILNDKVFTAPDSLVLKGITRDYVIKSINDLGLDLIKKSVLVEDVLNYDAMFISGTSPKVLPINKIISCCEADAANPVLRQIMKAFDKQIEKHLV